jgi:hypothetical protein
MKIVTCATESPYTWYILSFVSQVYAYEGYTQLLIQESIHGIGANDKKIVVTNTVIVKE